MCNNINEVKEYVNYQTGEKLDLERVSKLKDNAMLKVKPELWLYWNFKLNSDLDIWKITKSSRKKAWWYCNKCDDSYPQVIESKVRGYGCSICRGFYITNVNSLASLYPTLSKEWHPSLNGNLTPHDVGSSSNKKYWWQCSKCESSYETSIYDRAKGISCPYCAGKKVNSTNSLATLSPEIAMQWHPTKNGELTPHDVTCGSSHKKYWWIGECGHEWDSVIYNTVKGKGCPYCQNNNGRILIGVNDMHTTNSDLAKLLLNQDDGYRYKQNSNVKVDWKCPDCNSIIRNKQINAICRDGLSCPKCRDGISFPEKIMYNTLKYLEIELSYDSIQNWSNRKRYDFYIPSLNTIIETHGGQHYQETNRKGARTLKQEQKNDKYKYELAINNGVKPENYIVIDCRKSDFEFIKNNILNSRLAELINFDNVNWEIIKSNSQTSILKNIATLWNEGLKVKEIAQETGFSRTTIKNHLKLASEINLCNYTVKDAKLRGSSSNNRAVVQLNLDGEFICVYESLKEASIECNVFYQGILGVCKGRKNTAYGYKWMYKDEYEQSLENSIPIKTSKINLRDKSLVQLKLNGSYVAEWNSISEASRVIGLKSPSGINSVCRGKQISAAGFKWMYKEDYDKYIENQSQNKLA